MHKTSVTDWLTYVQHIMQPSFVGSFDVVGPIGICLQCSGVTPIGQGWTNARDLWSKAGLEKT